MGFAPDYNELAISILRFAPSTLLFAVSHCKRITYDTKEIKNDGTDYKPIQLPYRHVLTGFSVKTVQLPTIRVQLPQCKCSQLGNKFIRLTIYVKCLLILRKMRYRTKRELGLTIGKWIEKSSRFNVQKSKSVLQCEMYVYTRPWFNAVCRHLLYTK